MQFDEMQLIQFPFVYKERISAAIIGNQSVQLSSKVTNHGNNNKNSPSSVTSSVDSGNLNEKKLQSVMTHRLVEKKRRDRLNKSLEQLKNILPFKLNGKNKSKLDKIEILELAIETISTLKTQLYKNQAEESQDNYVTKNAGHYYNKGLKDGMDAMLEYFKKFNQIETKINENILKQTDRLTNYLLASTEFQPLEGDTSINNTQTDLTASLKAPYSTSNCEFFENNIGLLIQSKMYSTWFDQLTSPH